jgi:CRISPR/Cas system-associated exonuclease Cas4 (RecB family)
MLRAFEECHQKVYLLRSGKKNPQQDIRGFFHGTVVDRVMREWLDQDHPEQDLGSMSGMVRDIMDREELHALATGDGVVRWKHPKDREETIGFCVQLVQRLEPILLELVVPHEYEQAKRFKANVEIPAPWGGTTTITMAGETDLIVRTVPERRWQVWDLKGTRDDSYWRKTIGQLVFYDLAMGVIFGEKTAAAGLIQPMCKQRVVPVQITDEMRTELMARVIRYAHAIMRTEWEPREDMKYCTYCPVRHACVKFKPVGDVASRRLSLLDMRTKETVLSAESLLAPGA